MKKRRILGKLFGRKRKVPVHPDGLQLVASSAEHKPMPECTDAMSVVDMSGELVRYKCGHEFHSHFSHNFFGEKREISDEYLAKREKCGECMLEMVRPHIIRCACCGFAIFPGEDVALYCFDKKHMKDCGHRVGENVLGCMRWNCCPSGGFFAGQWDGVQFVSAFEGLTAAGKAFTTGGVVIVSGSGDE